MANSLLVLSMHIELMNNIVIQVREVIYFLFIYLYTMNTNKPGFLIKSWSHNDFADFYFR